MELKQFQCFIKMGRIKNIMLPFFTSGYMELTLNLLSKWIEGNQLHYTVNRGGYLMYLCVYKCSTNFYILFENCLLR